MTMKRKRKSRLRLDVVFAAAGLAAVLFTTMSLLPTLMHQPEKSVVMLVTSDGRSGGTGFEVLSPSGHKYIVTNEHMCAVGATNAIVNGRTIPLRVIEQQPTPDLCLLEPIAGLPPLRLAGQDLRPGDLIDIYGYGMLLPLTHTSGVYVGDSGPMITAYFGFVSGYATAQILPGNSGSPVLNSNGDVVGIVFASGEAIGYRTLFVVLKDLKDFLAPY